MGSEQASRRHFFRQMAAATTALAPAGRASECEACGSVWERPPKQHGNDLNLILLVSDTFRRDNLACYGSQWVECPNLNRFAEECVIVDDYYPEGMPTLPVRRTLVTGRRVFPFRYYRQDEPVQAPGWHNLYNEDVTLSETLLEAGYTPALISDLLHLQRPGRNFHKGYRVYEWIRGQEGDFYGTVPHEPLDVSDIVPNDYLEKVRGLRGLLTYFKVNRERWSKEGEALVELVARSSIRWLKGNHSQRPFFLHVEAFDPHEPWEPPARFLEQYLPNAKGYSWIQPPYANIQLSDEATKRMRANYAGEASCVDFWFGQVLNTIRELGLFENSVVAFTTDHGALLGEQGQFVKGPERLRGQVTHIPLLIRLPGKQFAGQHVSGFVQIPDLMPTLLSLLGLKSPSRVTGTNFWPLVTGEAKSARDHVVTGFGYVAAVRTREWNYSQVWNAAAYKGSYSPQLYDLARDPKELTNVADKYPAVVERLSGLLKEYVASGERITRGSFFERYVSERGKT